MPSCYGRLVRIGGIEKQDQLEDFDDDFFEIFS
jgi:hypothetical protein